MLFDDVSHFWWDIKSSKGSFKQCASERPSHGTSYKEAFVFLSLLKIKHNWSWKMFHNWKGSLLKSRWQEVKRFLIKLKDSANSMVSSSIGSWVFNKKHTFKIAANIYKPPWRCHWLWKDVGDTLTYVLMHWLNWICRLCSWVLHFVFAVPFYNWLYSLDGPTCELLLRGSSVKMFAMGIRHRCGYDEPFFRWAGFS